MSWQIPAFTLMAVVLIVGFVWYERSRPPSQIVALVAALAAISVAGRVVFSPIPNVVPVTDITLITGFVLGPAPGFAVGALSALVSNLWLGQGPWTPWQMAGWGLVGLGGAWLAVVTRGRISRLGLAAVCGLAGFAYGALLDLYTMVSFGGEQSLDRYLVLSARGLPFNIAHAGGNVLFAVAAGPALIAMLSRYRRRFEFAWSAPRGALPPAAESAAAGGRRPGAIAGGGCVFLIALAVAIASGPLAGSSAAAPASPTARPSAATVAGPHSATAPVTTRAAPTAATAAAGRKAAIGWLRRAQNRDGGFSVAPGGASSAVMTGWASLGLESAGINPFDVRTRKRSAMRYLKANVEQIASTGDLERTILVVAGAGANSRKFAGVNLINRLLRRRAKNGSWSGQVNLTAFGIMAVSTSGKGVAKSADWLAMAQGESGGWGIAPGAAPDADSTGAALQALAIAEAHDEEIDRGVAFLQEIQRDSGGYNLLGGPLNSQSTAWAVQGLVAAGVSPGSVLTGGNSPLDYLAARQAADGHFRYSAASNQTPVWVTAQALSAVTKQAFPIAPVPRKLGGGSKQKSKDKGKGKGKGTGGSGAGAPSAGGSSGGAAAPGGRDAGATPSAATQADEDRARGAPGGAAAPSGSGDLDQGGTGGSASGSTAAPSSLGGAEPTLLRDAVAAGDRGDNSLPWLVGGGMALLIGGLLGGWFRYGRGL